GLDPGAAGAHLAGEPREALPAVGGTPGQGGDPLLLPRGGLLGRLPGGDGRLELRGGLVDLGPEGVLVGASTGRLLAQGLGVTPARRLDLLVLAEEADPLGGERRRRAEPVGERGEADGTVHGRVG